MEYKLKVKARNINFKKNWIPFVIGYPHQTTLKRRKKRAKSGFIFAIFKDQLNKDIHPVIKNIVLLPSLEESM